VKAERSVRGQGCTASACNRRRERRTCYRCDSYHAEAKLDERSARRPESGSQRAFLGWQEPWQLVDWQIFGAIPRMKNFGDVFTINIPDKKVRNCVQLLRLRNDCDSRLWPSNGVAPAMVSGGR
jgi:hypothetical protein